MTASGSFLAQAVPAAAALALFTLWEGLAPLRRTVERKGRRVARNLGLAGMSYAALALLHVPLTAPVTAFVERRGVGLLHVLPIPPALGVVLGIILLDYTLWHWHWMNHRIGLFWRFHSVHHMDRDLDASTALRFHFGEMSLSVAYRVLQLVVIGPSATALLVWQVLLSVSILFHHGNIRLPLGLERRLVRLVVTPRMHGIHHSIVPTEANANYSSLVSLWDVLHGTLRLDVPQDEITIGIPSHQAAEQVTLGHMLKSPFVAPVPEWRFANGEAPRRDPAADGSGPARMKP